MGSHNPSLMRMTLLYIVFLPPLLLAQSQRIVSTSSCEDQGCHGDLQGRTSECVDVRGADWRYLNTWYQLNQTLSPGLCKQTGADQCCKCLAKHLPEENPCKDQGCQDQWGGQGLCVSVFSREFPKMVDVLLDLSVGGKSDLCGDGCCTCFKTNYGKKEYDYRYGPGRPEEPCDPNSICSIQRELDRRGIRRNLL